MLYPFGYGLSYTDFSLNITGVYTDEACTNALGGTVDSAIFASDEGKVAQVEKLYIPVVVRNEGDVTGKEVVEIYVTAPYKQGGVEKAHVVLAGFGKSSLLMPGESETVIVSINVQDFASYDYRNLSGLADNGGYVLEDGEYVIRATSSSHVDLATDVADATDAYDQKAFTLASGAALKLDDFSHKLVENLFSTEIGEYTNATEGEYALYSNSMRTADYAADGVSAMQLMSRADLDGTFPQPPTEGDLTLKDDVLANWIYWNTFGWNESQSKKTDFTYSDAGLTWADVAVPEGWTQTQTAAERNEILLADVAGIDPYDDSFTLQTGDPDGAHYTKVAAFDGLTADQAWQLFMNQLSYEEVRSVVETGGWATSAVPSIGKLAGIEADTPNNLSSTHNWCDETTIASTWNTDLAHKQGIIVGDMAMYKGVNGWWGPGMDTHRSPFSGRNNEYYSQGIPIGGYTKMIERMLAGIEVRLDVDYLARKDTYDAMADRVVYTGPIDAYFDYALGPLHYRSLRFEHEVLETDNDQGNAVVNFTDRETPYTRVIEHKWFEFGRDAAGHPLPHTVISREYSSEWKPGDEPYHPVNDGRNAALYRRYRELADAQQRVLFCGRLAEYRYYDMDAVIAREMAAWEEETVQVCHAACGTRRDCPDRRNRPLYQNQRNL